MPLVLVGKTLLFTAFHSSSSILIKESLHSKTPFLNASQRPLAKPLGKTLAKAFAHAQACHRRPGEPQNCLGEFSPFIQGVRRPQVLVHLLLSLRRLVLVVSMLALPCNGSTLKLPTLIVPTIKCLAPMSCR